MILNVTKYQSRYFSQNVTSYKYKFQQKYKITKVISFFLGEIQMANTENLKFAQNRSLAGFDKENEGQWNGPFYFIQAADTQFGMIDSYIKKLENPQWDEEIRLTRQALEAVHLMNPRPRFFIICGDLIDALPGTKYRTSQEKDFLRIFSELDSDIPLICVCGNHDVGNKPTSVSIRNYQDRFGDDYYTFYCGGVMFIVLNSQFFEDPSEVQDLAKDQDLWLDRMLEEAKSGNFQHVIVFQHIPLFLQDPDEEKIYFNLEPEIRKRLLKKFYDANIRAIFCGHYHGNAGGFYKELEVVVTSAIGAQLRNEKSGFRVVKVLDSTIAHQYYALEEAPKIILLDS